MTQYNCIYGIILLHFPLSCVYFTLLGKQDNHIFILTRLHYTSINLTWILMYLEYFTRYCHINYVAILMVYTSINHIWLAYYLTELLAENKYSKYKTTSTNDQQEINEVIILTVMRDVAFSAYAPVIWNKPQCSLTVSLIKWIHFEKN